MKIRQTALTFALTALAGLGVLRGGAAEPAGGRVVINYWEKWTRFEAAAMQAVIDDFNRSQDRIEVRFLPMSPIDVKLMLAASSGNPPDLAGLWEYSIPDFAEKGALLPLDEALAKVHLGADHFLPAYWELGRHRGFTWALPTTPGCMALYYNKKLFREAGLDPERPPRTWAELEAMSRRLTRVEVKRAGLVTRVSFDELTGAERQSRQYSIFQIGHQPADAGMFVSAWGLWFGAKYYDGDRRITANDAGNVAAYRWLRDVTTTYGLDNLRDFSAAYGQSQTSQSPFLAGTAAMVVNGPWLKNFIDKFAPDIEWGVAACPAYPGVADDAPRTLVVSDMIVIPRGAKHPHEAFEFICYLQRQDVAERLNAAMGKFTALRDVSPEFIARHPNPAIQTFIDLARSPNAVAVPRLSNWREFDIEMSIAAMRARYLLLSPEDALAVVQQRMQWRHDRIMRRWDIVQNERLAEWRDNERW